MTFDQALEWLFSTQHFGIKLGLENISRLLEALGDPRKNLRFIHVAGTNGKGSVCAMLDALLRAQGLRTGLYTSPHLVDFRERIRIDGVKIPHEAVAESLTRLRRGAENLAQPPTFFEITTALALDFFAREECDVVILETGMGGRLDATNVVIPLVSVITPIAMDHTEWLGDTLAKIAAEKAGIIKPHVPVVSAWQEKDAEDVLRKTAEILNAPLKFVEAPLEGFSLNLRGDHQRWNAALALEALAAAGLSPRREQIESGLKDVIWPGRFHIVDRLVLDGAHNPHAAAHLVRTWREVYGDEKATVIFSALQDKDAPGIIKILEAVTEKFFFVPVRNERSDTPENFSSSTSLPNRCFSSVDEALEVAQAESRRTLVTGSLFLIGDAMEALRLEP